MRSACALMQAGAHMVKLEGGGWTTETVRFLVERGIPVCAHLGLTPQTRARARRLPRAGQDATRPRRLLRRQARELQDAGAAMLVLEMVPAALAAELTARTRALPDDRHRRRPAAPPARCWCCTTCSA